MGRDLNGDEYKGPESLIYVQSKGGMSSDLRYDGDCFIADCIVVNSKRTIFVNDQATWNLIAREFDKREDTSWTIKNLLL